MSATDRLATSIVAAFAVTACAANPAPEGYLPTAPEAGSTAHGGWVEIWFRGEQGTERVEGELIAVSADSVWVLPTPTTRGSTEGGVVLAVDDAVRGQLVAYDSRHGQVAAGTLVGVLSTISNGVLLVFTAPMWIIGGSLAAASQSRLALTELPPSRWPDLSLFARFPQGMPPGLRLDDLRSKAR